MTSISTVEATPNIAVIKYWGKRDEKLILPTNSSLSFTLDNKLKTRTTVIFSDKFLEDELWINGQKMDLTTNEMSERIEQLNAIRNRAKIKEKAKIASLNCFPTAAGFASSASGLAALACAASKAAGLNLTPTELSILARLGSGSATRSILGGFVEWTKGEKPDGSDSFAIQIAPHTHWPELKDVVVITNSEKKKISSRAGMKRTIETSTLYSARIKYLSRAIEEIKQTVINRDFAKFGEIIMKESSNMHSVMLDTWPPIIYLNDKSREIIYKIHEINAQYGELIAAYTFDAGPNAHIFTTKKYEKMIKNEFEVMEGIKQTITCGIGSGPKHINSGHLIDETTGKVNKYSHDEKTNEIIVE